MAQVEEYTVDVESTGKASDVLGYYATDMSPWADTIKSQPMPAHAQAGVSILATLKSVTSAWHRSLDDMVEEMKGLSTACSTSAKLYHETEETVTRVFRPSGKYGRLAS